MHSQWQKSVSGFKGLKGSWGEDLKAGLLVALVALPLSLGIAEASGFPPAMGLITAIAGGMLGCFLNGYELGVKGPAMSLIVIVAGAVEELGKGDQERGWHLALGAIVLAGGMQILAGLTRFSKYSDSLPLSVMHGVVAAIGIMLISREIPLAVGIAPAELKDKGTFALLEGVPRYLMHMEYHIAIIGLVSLMVMFGWKYLSAGFLKKLPPALFVLIISILLGRFFHLNDLNYSNFKPFVNTQGFKIGLVADFKGIDGGQWLVFTKYVMLLTIVGSIYSVVSAKAVDMLDQGHQQHDMRRDLMATGIGNVVSGMFGGVPMITEVVRSSENISNGAKTRFAGLYMASILLVFVTWFQSVIQMIPMAALASMLILAGFRLASPSGVKHIYHIGKEQLIIFLATVVLTLGTNIFWGLVGGIAVKLAIQLSYGVKLSHMLDPKIETLAQENWYFVRVPGSAVFLNYHVLKEKLSSIPEGSKVQVDFSDSPYVDHTVMENLNRFKTEYKARGGLMELIGLEYHRALSSHPFAARKYHKVTAIQ